MPSKYELEPEKYSGDRPDSVAIFLPHFLVWRGMRCPEKIWVLQPPVSFNLLQKRCEKISNPVQHQSDSSKSFFNSRV